MGFFSFLFGGKYPSTSKYEAKLNQAQADYEKFLKIASSANLKRLEELKAFTNTADFKNRVNKLKTEKFSGTEEYRKEQQLVALKKNSDLKTYFKFKNNKEEAFNRAKNSAAYQEYLQLDQVVKSRGIKELTAKAKVKDSEEAKILARYGELSKNADVKLVVKTLASSDLKTFEKVQKSDMLTKLAQLEEFVKTEAFIAKKKDLENKNRFKESPEYKDLMELEQLLKDKDLKWYAEKAEKKFFADYSKMAITFDENFSGSKPNPSTWSLGYWAGPKDARRVYSLADERQAFVEKNVSVKAGSLAIETIPGKAKGEVWNPNALGFMPVEFDCSSAIITTGGSFRQKFGRFVFKIKVSNANAPVTHNIWLAGDKKSEINVASFSSVGKKNVKTLMVGSVVAGATKTADVTDLKFESDYYIYTLDWTADKLVWSVNGVEVFSTKAGVPQEEMYIGLSSNVIGDGAISNAELDVEWIKVYSIK